MDWEGLRTGFFDELSKIAEISLHGLSPETVLEKSQPPPPMETPGLTKAQAILDRVQTIKTAAPIRGSSIGLPQYRSLGNSGEVPQTGFDKAKRMGVHAVGGVGIGKLMTEFGNHIHNVATKAPTPLKPSSKTSLIGMGAGGLLGLANYARTAHREKKMAKMSGAFLSPAEQLKSTRQVGAMRQDINQGPSMKAQIPLVGRKQVPGGVP
jgi:hypothetical protein